MRCRVIDLGGGRVALARIANPRKRRCEDCGLLTSDPKLCDHRTGTGKNHTCDRTICPSCATHMPPDTDYCRHHAGLHVEEPA